MVSVKLIHQKVFKPDEIESTCSASWCEYLIGE